MIHSTSHTVKAPAITDLRNEYGDHLERITSHEKKVLAATLLSFLDNPESDIYETLDECDPDCVLDENLCWVHCVKFSMEPPQVVEAFAIRMLIESTPSNVQVY